MALGRELSFHNEIEHIYLFIYFRAFAQQKHQTNELFAISNQNANSENSECLYAMQCKHINLSYVSV